MYTGWFGRAVDLPGPFIGTVSAVWHHLLGGWLWGEGKAWRLHTGHRLLWLGHDRDSEWVAQHVAHTLLKQKYLHHREFKPSHSFCSMKSHKSCKIFYIPFSKFQSPLGVGSPHVLSCSRQLSCLKNSRCQNLPRSATSTHYPALRPSTPLPASVSLRTNAKAGLRSAVSYPDSFN